MRELDMEGHIGQRNGLWAMWGVGCGEERLGADNEGTEGRAGNGGRQSQDEGGGGRMKLTMAGEPELRAQEAGGGCSDAREGRAAPRHG